MSYNLDFFIKKGCSYQEFIRRTPKNRERLEKVYSSVSIPIDLHEQIKEIETSIRLLVFAENWCSDTVLVLPIIQKLTELNENLDLIVVPRDDVIEEFKRYLLTKGKAKIPLVLFLIDRTDEVKRWIERTEYVDKEVKRIKSLDMKKTDAYRSVVQFYVAEGTIDNTTKVLACELIKAEIVARLTM